MLRPITTARPYSAPISATTLAPHGTSHNYTTPSGRSMGGMKISAARLPEMGGLGRFAIGAPVMNSQGRWRKKDPGAQYLTERESLGAMTAGDVAAQAGAVASGAKTAWQNESCHPLLWAGLALGWLVFGK